MAETQNKEALWGLSWPLLLHGVGLGNKPCDVGYLRPLLGSVTRKLGHNPHLTRWQLLSPWGMAM